MSRDGGWEAWMDAALCAQVDAGNIWHPAKGESTAPAKRICARCDDDVRRACLDWALRVGDRHAVLGGTSPRERRGMRRERRAAA